MYAIVLDVAKCQAASRAAARGSSGSSSPRSSSSSSSSDSEFETRKDTMAQVATRDGLVSALQRAGCSVKSGMSENGSAEYVVVGCTMSMLFPVAERLGVQIRLASLASVLRWERFQSCNVSHYRRGPGGDLFEPAEQVRLMRVLLETTPESGGAGVDLTSDERPDFVVDAFPLHDSRAVDALMRDWVKAPVSHVTEQPLEEIKEYFGAEVGMYFAFLGHYARWLVAPAVASVCVAIAQALTWHDSLAVPIYCILLMLWVTLMLEFWKRDRNALRYMWGLEHFGDHEEERLAYRGVPRVGTYVDGQFISLHGVMATLRSELEASQQFESAYTVRYYPVWRRRLTQVLSMPIVAFFLALVLITTISVLILRIILGRVGLWGGGYIAGAINALTIFVLNRVYASVALMLNSWENHRTDAEFERHLINKVFAFQFVNAYASLFYIAFFKTSNIFGKFQDNCARDDCVIDLGVQLFAIMTSRQLLGAIVEFAMPWAYARGQQASAWVGGKLGGSSSGSAAAGAAVGGSAATLPLSGAERAAVEREAQRAALTRTISQYAEIVTQLGYVLLFAAAFPLAAVFALANNVVEIRTDAVTLLKAYQRPLPHATSAIQDQWFFLLQVLAVVGVLTNCAIMMWTSKSIAEATGASRYGRLLIIVVVEHIVLAIMFTVRSLIPDSPAWVTTTALRSQFEQVRAYERLCHAEREKAAAALKARKAQLRIKYKSRYRGRTRAGPAQPGGARS
ncbi:transmembrane protein 16H [Thecamonas trahens ATCC 50062]|uniref:Transmembrane protein 16H n=1 Tax=Thecamonas trahens ATCC 50062 TaxID=461836 RepID=A0A0L0D6P9_THETB|nr:transmembrane protein 16H [Thecamonas trahens ATCC 50062]KNC47875.1 transmembrane protein 16H [Thecamonas trahens ATCC 50062]|eukprot:XP_013759353.1 transmembrane protein 16H [Thecamonas trahens ATCC 50062]